MTARSGRPTCFLHLGPPKTGSSTISHFIEGNLPELERLGYFVPRMPSLEGRPQIGHGMFANVAVKELDEEGRLRPAAKLWPELEAVAAEGEKHIILTNEAFAFSLRDPQRVDLILKFFERHGYDVRVLAYLRDQPGSLNSSYVQTQKRFYARQTFDEFVSESVEKGRNDLWRVLEHIIDNPRVSLDVGFFGAAQTGGLEADFSKRIDLPADATMQPVPTIRNPNAGAKTVYAAQQIMLAMDFDISKMGAYKKISRRFRKHFETRDWAGDPYVALDQETYERIREIYRESNERFAERFLGAPWSELSPDRTYRKNVFDPASATQDELDEIAAVVDDVVSLIRKARKLKSNRLQIKKRLLREKKRKQGAGGLRRGKGKAAGAKVA